MITDVKFTLYRLIDDNFDNSSLTGSPDVRVHTGWMDSDAEMPQVTVTNPDFTTVGGGSTGNYMYGRKLWTGTVLVNCASVRSSDLINPKKLVNQMSVLVSDIIHSNRFNVSKTDEVGIVADRELVDNELRPPWFRRELEVGAVVDE